MSFTGAVNAWRGVLAVLGALSGVCAVVGMLVGAVWTIGTIDAGFTDLSRRMGIAETQMAALTHQVNGVREAVIRLQDARPTRHADRPAFSSPAPGPDLWTDRNPDYRGGGGN